MCMYHITLIAVGKLKEHHWQDAWNEYTKRLRPYAKFDIKEIPDTSFNAPSEAKRVKDSEARKIREAIQRGVFCIALDRGGSSYSSERFAELLRQKGEDGDHVTFIIGGALGCAETLLRQAHLRVSLSQLTLPHQLARIVFAEQLYRAMTILHGKRYHY